MGKQRVHSWQVGMGPLKPLHSRMGPDATHRWLSGRPGTGKNHPGQTQPGDPRACALLGYKHLWVHLQHSPAHPNSCPGPHVDIAPAGPQAHSVCPFLAPCRHWTPFLPASPASAFGPSLEESERCQSCPGLPQPHPSLHQRLYPLCGIPTATLRKKSNVPTGTRGHAGFPRMLCPWASLSCVRHSHAKPLQLRCPPPGSPPPAPLGKRHSEHHWAECGPPCSISTHGSRNSCSPCPFKHRAGSEQALVRCV